MNLPEELLKNPHFSRYYRTWTKNRQSIVFVALAQICREYSYAAEALEICEEGLRHHPHSVSGQLMLARILVDLDRYAESQKIIENILVEFPGQSEAQQLLGKVRRYQQKATPEPIARPITSSTHEVELEPEAVSLPATFSSHKVEKAPTVPLWENVTMARIYASQGETKTARQILERLLARNPQHAEARNLIEEMT